MRPFWLILTATLAACVTPAPDHVTERAMFAALVEASRPYRVGSPPKPTLTISPSAAVQAYSVGCDVTVSEGMLVTVDGPPDELAHVLAHEIAHCVKGHTHSNPAVEREADVIGSCIAAAAGYDIKAALKIFERVEFRTEEFAARMAFLRDNDIGEYC